MVFSVIIFLFFNSMFSALMSLFVMQLFPVIFDEMDDYVSLLTEDMNGTQENIFLTILIFVCSPLWFMVIMYCLYTCIKAGFKKVKQKRDEDLGLRRRALSEQDVEKVLSTEDPYRPLPKALHIQNSHIEGSGLFLKKNYMILAGDVIGRSHVFTNLELVRTPLGGFINHSDTPNCVKKLVGNDYFIEPIEDLEGPVEITLKYTLSSPNQESK